MFMIIATNENKKKYYFHSNIICIYFKLFIHIDLRLTLKKC